MTLKVIRLYYRNQHQNTTYSMMYGPKIKSRSWEDRKVSFAKAMGLISRKHMLLNLDFKTIKHFGRNEHEIMMQTR